MDEHDRANEQEQVATGPDLSILAGTLVDDDDDTEAHGGKIFVRIESRLDDATDLRDHCTQ